MRIALVFVFLGSTFFTYAQLKETEPSSEVARARLSKPRDTRSALPDFMRASANLQIPFNPSPEKASGSSSGWEKFHKESEGGYVTDVACVNNKLFMSAGNELFVSTDEGASWNLSMTITQYMMINGYMVNWYYGSDRQIIASGDSILFGNQLSIDGGGTWSTVSLDKSTLPTFYLAPTVMTVHGKRMYLGTVYNGFFMSDDFGKTFTPMNSGYPDWYGFYSSSHAIEFYKNTPVIINTDGIYMWTGSYWENHTGTGLPTTVINHGTSTLVGGVDFLNTTWIASSNYGVYLSQNQGTTWQKINAIPDITGIEPWNLFSHPAVYYNVDVVNGTIYVSYRNDVYISSNGGTTWSHSQLPDQADIARIITINSSIITVSTDGVYKFSNNSWVRSNSGFERETLDGILTNGKDAFLSKSRGGVFHSTDQGQSWSSYNTGLNSGNTYLAALSKNTVVGSTYRYFTYAGVGISDSATAFISGISANQWNPVSNSPVERITSMVISSSGNYFMTGETKDNRVNGLFTSQNSGQTWSQIFSGITHNGTGYEDYISCLATKNDTLYAGTYFSGIYTSYDNGTSWLSITSNTNGWNLFTNDESYDSTTIEEIASIATLNNHLFATVFNNTRSWVMHSVDNGKTWTPLEFSGLNSSYKISPVWSLPFKISQNKIFIEVSASNKTSSKYICIYSDDYGKTWQQLGPDFPDYLGYLYCYEIIDNYLYAGGRSGLWRTPIPLNSKQVYFLTSNNHGTKNSDLIVPVKAVQFKNVISSQFSVKWDQAVATFASVDGFSLNGMNANSFGTSQASNGIITFSWSDPGVAAQTLADSTTVFNIHFKLTGNYGAKTSVTVGNQPLSIEVIDGNFQPLSTSVLSGIVTIDSVITMHGKILYPNNQPVQNVTLELAGITGAVTDKNGNYSVAKPVGANYTITPIKSNDPDPLNGIDVLDVVLIRRHVLGVQTLNSPYALISADVNKSKSISTLDLVYVQSLILGINPGFPGNSLWTFTPSTYFFPDPTTPFIYPDSATFSQTDGEVSQDFVAMKLGDVNEDRDNSQSTRLASQEKITFDILQEKVINENIEIQVRVKNFTTIAGVQFTVSWDKGKLEYQNISAGSIQFNFGKQSVADGKLTALWDEPLGKYLTEADGTEIVTLVFKNKDEGTYQDVTISGDITPVMIYNKDFVPMQYEVSYTKRSDDDYSKAVNVYPSPFDGKTTVNFYSSENSEADINLLDLLGRVIKSLRVKTVIGRNQVELSGSEFESGIYIVDLHTGSNTYKIKVIKN